MKVGFLNYWCSERGHNWHSRASDYQADMLFHGLKRLLKHDCVEEWPYTHMYEELSDENRAQIWGKGFTVYGNLERDLDPPTTCDDAELLVLPIHWSVAPQANNLVGYLHQLESQFPKARFAVVDGWDRPDIPSALLEYCRQRAYPYFKRELYESREGVFPISFAFPLEKVPDKWMHPQVRFHDIAPLIPVNQSIDPSYMSTYIYDDEHSYYEMYRHSKFALTSKKGGWDTLRHYEIMACGALPVFVDIDVCPENTLTSLPKDLLKRINRLHELHINTNRDRQWVPGYDNFLQDCSYVEKDDPGYTTISDERFIKLQTEMLEHFYNHCTTEALAKYFLETTNDYN